MSPNSRPQRGFVYVLTNPAYVGLVKIGHTTRHPETRAAELSAVTGVPARFTVAWYHPVSDHEALEGIVHGRLAACRANDNREFFRCSVPHARRVIEREAAALLLPWWRAWLHRVAHPCPSSRRQTGSANAARRAPDDRSGLLIVPAAIALAYVLVVKPAWLPPALQHLVSHLPGLPATQAIWPL